MSDDMIRQNAAGSVELHSIADRAEIAPGVMMPRLGIGTSHVVEGNEVESEILGGFQLGYRLIDTASSYHNEEVIGAALERSDVPREDFFITTKVWPTDQGYEPTLQAFEASRTRLGLEYIDLYLVHWPRAALMAETWRAFESLKSDGAVRAIGVSNFEAHDLKRLLESATVGPAVNQIEFHPHLQRPDLVAYCRTHGITVEAWSPLKRGQVGSIAELVDVGRRHGKSAAQVTIRWILQKGIIAIPKSMHDYRLRENADVFDFELTAEEMSEIDALDRDEHRPLMRASQEDVRAHDERRP